MWTKQTIVAILVSHFVGMCILHGQEIGAQPADVHHDAQLGVKVTDSPGVGVQVDVVAVDGPADHGGIQPGDFIMAINGKAIEKPIDLIAAVRGHEPGAEVVVRVWHDGDESDQKIILATASDIGHRSDRAWLGVTLEANGTVGAKIGQVIPGSPAAKAKLNAGDVIVAINDVRVDSAKQLIDALESFKSGDKITLKLAGDSDVHRMVTLENISSAPALFGYQLPAPDVDGWLPDPYAAPPTWRDEMADLRRQLQEIRKIIRDAGKQDNDPDDDAVDNERVNPNRPQADDASLMTTSEAAFQFVDYQGGSGFFQNPLYRYRPASPYMYYYRPGNSYWYRYVPRPVPYASYYRGYPYYQPYYGSFYQRYYRPGVQVYVGPYGYDYYYR